MATKKNAIPKIKRNIEKNILPQKPKKPQNPYFLYLQSARNKLRKDNLDSNIKHTEFVKTVSQEWAKIDPTIKEELKKKYSDEYVIYKQKLDDYNNSITEEQKILMERELIKKKSTLEKKQLKQVYIYIYIHDISILKSFESIYVKFNIDLFL